VYAFRKTFAVATYEGIEFAGMSYKVWLVTFQVVGYALSKFIGIKVVAELKAASRMAGIFLMVFIAGLAWLLFAFVPAPYNIIFLFLNGLPLGMVWGMVFSYLEGRRMTEVLGAALSVSFIFSAGLCRSVGALTMQYLGTSEYWMPFVTSCFFALPFLFFLLLLDQLPPPSMNDEILRAKRSPMNAEERKKFISTFFPGIVLFVIAYMLLTAFRDFRDNFSAEIWTSLGITNDPSIYTSTEIPVAIFVLACMASLMLVKNNKLALMINHVIIILGLLLIGVANFLFEQSMINASVWMMLLGTGLYMGYVPFNSIFFDRLLAAFRYAGTVGFIMYVSDSFGYLGSVGVLFFKEFGFAKLSWLSFFISGGYIVSAIGVVLIGGSMLYFHRKHKAWLPLNS
jgi:MFS family permease